MPSDLMIQSNKIKNEETEKEVINDVEESTILVSLRIEAEEEYLKEMESLKSVLASNDSTINEKNNAFEQIKSLSNIKGEQEKLEEKLSEAISSNVFVRIDGNQIKVVVDKKEHDTKLANQIMRLVQENYKNKMYITVKFQSSK
jgi:stage III sporulation protein AH